MTTARFQGGQTRLSRNTTIHKWGSTCFRVNQNAKFSKLKRIFWHLFQIYHYRDLVHISKFRKCSRKVYWWFSIFGIPGMLLEGWKQQTYNSPWQPCHLKDFNIDSFFGWGGIVVLEGEIGSEGCSNLCWLFVCLLFSFFCNINIRARQSSAVRNNMSHMGKGVSFTACWIPNFTILFVILSMTIFFLIKINL